MKKNLIKNPIYYNTLIWIGAGLSVAEILTGTYFAPLGMAKGILAIVLGHIVGGILMFFAGFVGAKSNKNSMESASISFGKKGAKFFAFLNCIQLLGWTGIMIYDASISLEMLFSASRSFWVIIIALLVVLWLLFNKQNLGIVNTIALFALFVLSLYLFISVFSSQGLKAIKTNSNGNVSESMSFIAAFELSIAMPLSWLPLISDYTCESKEKGFFVTLFSVIAYSIMSIWMYIVGMAMSIYTQKSDIAEIISNFKGFISIAGLYVIAFSTVTTTYLDAFSLGISQESLYDNSKEAKKNSKLVSICAVVIAAIFAMFFNLDNITNFLYLISSVFTPMATVLIIDYFILKKSDEQSGFNYKNIISWFIGFITYNIITKFELNVFIGSTVSAILITAVFVIVFHFSDNKQNQN